MPATTSGGAPTAGTTRQNKGGRVVRRKPQPQRAPISDVRSGGRGRGYSRPKQRRVPRRVRKALSGRANIGSGVPAERRTPRPSQDAGPRPRDIGAFLRAVNKLAGTDTRPGRPPKTPVLDALSKKETWIGPESVRIRGKRRRLETGSAAGIIKSATAEGGRLPDQAIRRRFVNDALDTMANAPQSAYEIGRAGVKAAQGDTKPAVRLLKTYKDTDPLALTVQGRFDEALEAAREHPFVAVADVVGLKGAAGRGAGAVARKAPSAAVREFASTARPTARTEGTNLAEKRSYSRDLITNRLQKRADRKKIKRAEAGYERARELRRKDPESEDAVQISQRAARQDPRVLSDTAPTGILRGVRSPQRRAAAEDSAKAHARLRDERAATTREAEKIRRKASSVTSAVVQNIVAPDPADILAYVRRLEDEYPKLKTAAERKANKKLRREFEKQAEKADPKAEAALKEQYKRIMEPLEAEAADVGVLPKARAERAKLAPHAVRWMGADVKRGKGPQRHGAPVAPEEVRADIAIRGMTEPGFVSQKPRVTGTGSFYRSPDQAQGLPAGKRTGRATREGTFDPSPDALVATPARLRVITTAAREFTSRVERAALRGEDGPQQFRSFADAQKKAESLTLASKHGEVWEPVRLKPFQGQDDVVRNLIERTSEDAIPQNAQMLKVMEQAFEDTGSRGPWVLVPRGVAQEMKAQLGSLGASEIGKVGQKINQVFRRNVLPTSPRWLAGNVIESGVRAALARATPRDYLAYKRAVARLKKTDPQAAADLQARVREGGNVGGLTQKMPRRQADNFQGTRFEGIADLSKSLWDAPGPKQAAAAWHRATDLVIEANARMEKAAQAALAGKYMRQELLGDVNAFRRVSDTAIEQAARGLRGTEEQVAMARFVDRAYGQYGKYPASVRNVMTTYVPFASWYVNAVKFMAWVLPVEHPLVFAGLANAALVTRDLREKHGLVIGGDMPLPGYLQGRVAAGGKLYPAARYMPFGAAADPLEAAAGQVLPQARGILNAAAGRDPFGRELKDKPDTLTKLGNVAGQAAGSFVPGVAPLQQIRRKESLGDWANPLSGIPENRSKSEYFAILDRIERMPESEKYVTRNGVRYQTPRYRKLLDRKKALAEKAGIKRSPRSKPPPGWKGSGKKPNGAPPLPVGGTGTGSAPPLPVG